MSDEEHQFESKVDAGASKTYPQQAGTVRKNDYLVIKNRHCKVTSSEAAKGGGGEAETVFILEDSCSCRVRISLNLKEFRKLNPIGYVPVLVDGDIVIADSFAILMYLEEKYPRIQFSILTFIR